MIELLNEYQTTSRKTAEIYKPLDAFSIFTMGAGGERGELSELIKKWVGHGHALSLTELTKEGGDALWYPSQICDLVELKLGVVWESVNYMPILRTYKDSNFTALQHAALDTVGMMEEASAMMFKYSRQLLTCEEPSPELWVIHQHIKANLIDFISGLKALFILFDIDINEVVRVNNAKLAKRYQGEFSTKKSLKRVDV